MKVAIYTLGCKVNQYETQAMEQTLRARGHKVVDFSSDADAYVVNTCSVTAVSDQKSRQVIHRAKRQHPAAVVAVCGCYPQTHPEDVRKLGVDLIAGTGDREGFVSLLEEAAAGKKNLEAIDKSFERRVFEVLPAGGMEGRTRAMLKIEDGCVNFCTYCIIPKLRGKFRSVPMERLVTQAKEMAEEGVKELILVAQETTVYGTDIYGKKSLHVLLKELCKIKGIRWIRILYCYPEEIYDELIQTMKEEKKICHYLDLPIQHANDEILKRMGRRTTKQELIDIISKLRREIPDIALRTTLITGFPGETKEQHEELMEFVDEMEFDRLGVFTYSPEEDTAAARMEGQIEEEVKEERQAELMELQQEIAFDTAENMVGKEVLVMIEGKVADENAYVGRTYRDAPNVDGLIFVNTEEELMSGDFAKVKVSGAVDYDLIGELL